jgi:uncharacterized alpha-E superfamily protein
MSRYIERAENTARIILVNHNLLLDMPRHMELGWEPMVAITGNRKPFREHYDEATERNVVRFLVSDPHNPNCIVASLAQARENLRTTRAIVPRGAWETLNDLFGFAGENKASGASRRGRYQYMRHIIDHCQMLAGKLSGTSSHDQTYDFLRMGRNMERADMTTRVIEVRASDLVLTHSAELKPFDDIQWKSVLDSLAAYQMYRRHVHVRVHGEAVLRFLLHDDTFPRAVHYCLSEVGQCLRTMPGNDAPLRVLGRAQRLVQEVGIAEIAGSGLNRFIDALQQVHTDLHNQIAASYFDGAEDIRDISETRAAG